MISGVAASAQDKNSRGPWDFGNFTKKVLSEEEGLESWLVVKS